MHKNGEYEKLKMAEEEGKGGRGGGGVSSGGEESSSSSSPTGGERVKLFCSQGGKILPRPTDGSLKYVGGETRVVAIPRSITFSELMTKINNIFDGEYVLKYQIASEDLDSLVSVKSDEDIRHLLDEYDRLEREGCSKLRTYLFPVKPLVTDQNQSSMSVLGPHALEQRFVDAINGVVRPVNNPPSKLALNTSRLKSISPSPTDCPSPQSLSPRSNVASSAGMNPENCLPSGLQGRIARFHRVASSPASLDSQQNLVTMHPNGYITQQPHSQYPSSSQHQRYFHGYQYPVSLPQEHYLHGHHGYQSPTPPHQSPTRPQEHHMHPSPPQHEYAKVPLVHGPVVGHHNPKFHPMQRLYPGSGGHSRWGHLEQYATGAACGSSQMTGADGLPRSPG